jgi:hypothetical protein
MTIVLSWFPDTAKVGWRHTITTIGYQHGYRLRTVRAATPTQTLWARLWVGDHFAITYVVQRVIQYIAEHVHHLRRGWFRQPGQ